MQLGSYGLIAITEMWCSKSYSWNTAIKSNRGERDGRRDGGEEGGGVALCVKKWIDCEEPKNCHQQVESL